MNVKKYVKDMVINPYDTSAKFQNQHEIYDPKSLVNNSNLSINMNKRAKQNIKNRMDEIDSLTDENFIKKLASVRGRHGVGAKMEMRDRLREKLQQKQ